jgi:protease I
MQGIILAADGVEDRELLYPYDRLREEGVRVDIAAPEPGPVAGRHDCYPIEATQAFFDMWGADYYDVLVLPGGTAPERIRHNGRVHALIRDMLGAGNVVVAIGHGVETLVSMDVLDGRQATCAPGVRDELELAGAQYVDEPVVVDGNLITGRGVDDLPHICREMIKALKPQIED